MRRHRRLFVVLVLPAALLAASCSKGPTLDETSWEAVTINGSAPVSDRPVQVSFANGEMTGNDGCNSFSGGYEQKGDQLEASGRGFVGTAMGCPDDIMSQADVFIDVLIGPSTMVVEGDTLTLSSDDSQVSLQLLEDG